jgi:dTDP-glucose pyrophosphorylase
MNFKLKMIIVIPMAGLGSRFTSYGFKTNKYLLPVNFNLTPMIHEAVKTIGAPSNAKFIFIIRNDQVESVKPVLLSMKLENFKIHVIDKLTEGPASTVYESHHLLESEEPLIVSNSDQVLKWNYDSFIKRSETYDGCVLTYTPKYELILGQTDKHSFIKTDQNGKIIQVAEKLVLSRDALVGVHYYKKARYFIEAYKYMVANNIRAPNGEYYLSNSYQALLDNGCTVGSHHLTEGEEFWPVGEPMDYFSFLKQNLKTHNFEGTPVTFISEPGSYALRGAIAHINSGMVTRIDGVLDLKQGESCVFINEDDIFEPKHISEFARGWIIGNFEPSIFKRTDYEVAIMNKSKDEKLDFHYHKEAIEYNVFVKGAMEINGKHLTQGQFFVLDKNQISCPIFHEDSIVICVKVPSAPYDKYSI